MGYAVRNDGIYGVRAVNSADDCAENEYFSDVFVEYVETITDKRERMTCAAWQFKRALTAMGLRDAVETAIAAADYDTKDMWNATTFRRTNPRIIAMAASLGQSDDDLDALFDLALTFNE